MLGVVSNTDDWVFDVERELKAAVRALHTHLSDKDSALQAELERAVNGPPGETLWVGSEQAGEKPDTHPEIDRRQTIFDLPGYLREREKSRNVPDAQQQGDDRA